MAAQETTERDSQLKEQSLTASEALERHFLLKYGDKKMAQETKFCVVCGEGSNRDDWQGKAVVACDGHSKAEIQAALQKKTAASTPSTQSA